VIPFIKNTNLNWLGFSKLDFTWKFYQSMISILRKHQIVAVITTCSLILAACGGMQKNATATVVPESTADVVALSPPAMPTQTATYPPEPINPTEPDPAIEPILTPAPTQVDKRIQLREIMSTAVESEEWSFDGLSDGRVKEWESFSGGEVDLSEKEFETLKSFVERWQLYRELAETQLIPSQSIPIFRVNEIETGDGEVKPVLYLVDKLTSEQDGKERLFLVARDNDGEPVSLVLSANIAGLNQRISKDGDYVVYFDDRADWLIKADARLLDNEDLQQEILINMLVDEMIYQGDLAREYVVSNTYPRFFFNITAVKSGFFALGNLTHNQLLLLESVLKLFDENKLAGLGEYVFSSGENVDYIISREPHPIAAALARPLGGTPRKGIVVLFSKNLFDNKYATAASISHEAAHIWQGITPGCDEPERRLKREIGNGSIQQEFYDWAPDDLYDAVLKGDVGSYHLSLWVYRKYGMNDYANWVKSIINTGAANGHSIINCGV